MTHRWLTITTGTLLAVAARGHGQAPAPPPSRAGAVAVAASDQTPSARLINEIRTRQRAVADVEFLSDVIGSRLTTSAAIIRAHTWAESTMTARGLTRVHREAYGFGPSWTRGAATARLLTQNGMALLVAQLAWSPSTPGPVRGDILAVSAGTIAELDALTGHLRGRILMIEHLPSAGADSAAVGAALGRFANATLTEGALAAIFSSTKANGAMNMVGSPVWRSRQIPRMPTALMAAEHYEMIRRAVRRGERVTLEIDLSGVRTEAPVDQFNSVGEIRGSEWPDEVVILGAHIDSWDLGAGATDDGTGVAAVLEAMRAIVASGLVPKRTIRVVLFSAEEQGHLGSKAYVLAHADQMQNVQAMLQHDLGTGRVRGFALQGREDLRPFMARAIAPLNDLGVVELPLEVGRDSDHDSFTAAGVPAMFAVQDTLDYFTVTHHSQFDTFDHVRPGDLIEGATALAVTAWELANMPERLPHRARLDPPHEHR